MDVSGLDVRRRARSLFGAELIVEYVCMPGHGCEGYSTGAWVVSLGEEARQAMLDHLIDAHPKQCPGGRCAECGRLTDHFHADSQDGRLWLCERDAPVMPAQGGEVVSGDH